jgi:hypothetical protein
MVALDLEEG